MREQKIAGRVVVASAFLISVITPLLAALVKPSLLYYFWVPGCVVICLCLAYGFSRYSLLLRESNRRGTSLVMVNKTLLEAAKVVASLDIDEEACVRELTRMCCDALDVTRAALWRREEANTNSIRMITGYDARTKRFLHPLVLHASDYPIFWEGLCRDGEVIVSDSAVDRRTRKLYKDFYSELGQDVAMLDVAVQVDGKVQGLFSFHQFGTTRAWTPEENILVRGIAELVAQAFQRRAKLHAQQELSVERNARSQAEQAQFTQNNMLREHAETLASVAAFSLSDPPQLEMFQHLTEVCGNVLGVTSASVWLEVQDQEGVYELKDRFWVDTQSREQGSMFSGVHFPEYYQRLVNERSVAIVDAANDSAYRPVHQAVLGSTAKTSILAAAVRLRERPVGLVSFMVADELRDWTVEDGLFVGALSDVIALVLERDARFVAEQRTRNSEQRLSSLIAGTPLAAIDWNTDGNVMGWNSAAERMFGYTPAEAEGLSVHRLHRQARDDAWSTLKNGTGFVERFENVHSNGKALTCEWRNTLLTDTEGVEIGITSLVQDISARLASEAEVRKLNDSLEERVLERTSELSAANAQLRTLDRLKSEFLAMMSHELRTPLNSVIGFSAVLKSKMAGPINEEQDRQLGMISGSAKHLLGLINDVLDVSRIEAGKLRVTFTSFAPSEVLDEVRSTLLPMVERKGIELCVENQCTDEILNTDRTRYFQILVNLVNNAIKFTEHGRITLTVAAADGGVVVLVRDTGCGIHKADVAGIFKAFQQVDSSSKREHEGTGLGLYLCNQLSALLGGHLSVESEVGVGSCFSLWLPLTYNYPKGMAR